MGTCRIAQLLLQREAVDHSVGKIPKSIALSEWSRPEGPEWRLTKPKRLLFLHLVRRNVELSQAHVLHGRITACQLDLTPEKAFIFRIVHFDNLAWILDNVLHARNGDCFDGGYRNIGNPELIDRRMTREVPVPPYGTLGDYIPFYFTPHSIMMFNIITGHGVVRVPKDEITILVTSIPKVRENGVQIIFTDQHAYPPMASYYTNDNDLDEVDWPLLRSRNFRHNPDDPGKKERYQAEALIWKVLPLDALLGICCFSDTRAKQLKQEITKRNLSINVASKPSWYF